MQNYNTLFEYKAIVDKTPITLTSSEPLSSGHVIELGNRRFWVTEITSSKLNLVELK